MLFPLASAWIDSEVRQINRNPYNRHSAFASVFILRGLHFLYSACVLTLTQQPLHEVLFLLRRALQEAESVTFNAPDPAGGCGLYAGEVLPGGSLYRSWQSWADIAERLNAQLLTPEKQAGGRVQLTLRRLPPVQRLSEYGQGSDFQRLNKLEDPWFLDTFVEALQRCNLAPGARILSVGVGSGRELEALALAYPEQAFEVVGLDLDPSAVALARERYVQAGGPSGWRFEVADLNALPQSLGQFDTVLALSVLQSRHVTLDTALRGLIKWHLKPTGALVVGLPNCRYTAGEVRYGARMLNFRDPDLSLLLADAALIRRHLQKHSFKVWVTGKYEVLITGLRGERSP